MSYIDSSALLKTLWEERESDAVRRAIAGEEQVVVSTLAELETEVQLRARWLGGATSKARYAAYRAKLASFRNMSPFEFRDLLARSFDGPFSNTCRVHGIADRLTGCILRQWTS